MSSFRKGDRCVTYDATFVAGRIAEDAPVYQVRRETGAACAGSESPRVDSPSLGRALREEPEAIRPELADVRKNRREVLRRHAVPLREDGAVLVD
jgi:hypothetical protein